MKCIHCYDAPLAPVHYLGKQKHHPKREENLFWLSTSNARTQVLVKGQTTRLPVHFRPNAVGPSLILAESLPALAGRADITVFLRTSTALFFVYWLANFVVPEMISKDFEKNSKELNPDDDNTTTNDEAGNTTTSGKNRPESKQKGFQSTKHK